MSEVSSRPAGRIRVLDAWRGVAVLVMIGWHFCWDLGLMGVWPQDRMFTPFAVAVRYFIVCSFVILAGISARFSRSNYRRGLLLLGCAAVITLVTWLADQPAWFGILHLLSCCLLLYGLLGPSLRKLPEGVLLGVSLALFAVLHAVCYGIRISVPGLWMFGLRTPTFESSDYYPLFPWMFLFLAGTVAGGRLKAKPPALPAPELLCRIGRNALWIYMLHQPILLGITWLIAHFQGG